MGKVVVESSKFVLPVHAHAWLMPQMGSQCQLFFLSVNFLLATFSQSATTAICPNITPSVFVVAITRVVCLSLAPDCSRLQSSPNIQSGKYKEMDPILIGTAVSVVSYTTDSIALVPSRNVCREGTSAIKLV